MSTQQNTTEEMTQEVFALMAQAYLLRIRGAWQEAVDKCMAALRIFPGNCAAQSLLGDIYENQGKHDDAIRWYRMALDTNPNSPADKAKLARLIALQGQHLDDIAQVPPPSQVDAQIPAGVIAKSNALRATAILCGACLFGIVLTAIVQSHGSADARRHTQPANRTLQIDNDQTYPQQSPFTNIVSARDPFEVTLFDGLRAVDLPQDIRFADVVADPRNGRLTLTYVVRPEVSVDRDAVLRTALRAVESASSVASSVSYAYFTVRLLLSSDDLVTAPDSGTLIFIGDIGRTDIVDLSTNVASIPSAQVSSAFANQWWAPTLTPPVVAPAPLPTNQPSAMSSTPTSNSSTDVLGQSAPQSSTPAPSLNQ